MIFAKKKILVWCDDPPEDPVISIFAGCLANHDRAHSHDNLDVSDPTDPEVIIKIDVANAFNSTNRGLTPDVLNGRDSRDYTCGLKKGDVVPTCDTLSNLFGYFKAMRSCEAKLR